MDEQPFETRESLPHLQGVQENGAKNQNPGEPEDYLYFNVMPKTESLDNLVPPAVQVQKTTVSEKSTKKKSAFLSVVKKYKLLIFISSGIIILGTAGYFGWTWYLQKQAQNPESILNPEALKTTKQNQPVQNSPQPDTAYLAAISTPKDWQLKYFGKDTCQDFTVCGDKADPDKDSLINVDEYKLGTDPNNPDSDGDGLADGDEVNIFGSDPQKKFTVGNTKYTDADYIKGGFELNTSGKKFSDSELMALKTKMQQMGLHDPTTTTLGDSINSLYHLNNISSNTPTDPLAGLDVSLNAKQDRDTQRNNTIKNIGIALIGYQQDHQYFPNTNSFSEMFNSVKVYSKVATNPVDPINKTPYVYGYQISSDDKDFTLSFFSESQNQLIKIQTADAQKYKTAEESGIYDNQRVNDLESMHTALLLYSNDNIAGNQNYVFPSQQKYQTELVPKYISSIPKDPKTHLDYEYQVSEKFDSFTLKIILDNPATGYTGYLCNPEECRNY